MKSHSPLRILLEWPVASNLFRKALQPLALAGVWAAVVCWAVSATPTTAAELMIDNEATRQFVASSFRQSVALGTFNWTDHRRGRPVAGRIYYPATETRPCPVILLSTGLGRSESDCAYLGYYWASHGYVSVHVDHEGSDDAVWEGKLRPRKALRDAFDNPVNIRNRPRDISFVLNKLEEMQREGTRIGRKLDLSRVGAAGHDFGALTSLLLAGQSLVNQPDLADPRITAVVAMSPPVDLTQPSQAMTYAGIRVPCIYFAGTEDDGIVGSTKASQRRIPFDMTMADNAYLVTFIGGDHMVYGGHFRAGRNEQKDATFQRLICLGSTAFWDAYLKGDPRAINRLASGGLSPMMGNRAHCEQRVAEPAVLSSR